MIYIYYVTGSVSFITSILHRLIVKYVHLVGPLVRMRMARDVEVGAIPKAMCCA